MDSFSVLSLTSHCTNISHVAICAAIDLTSLTQQLPSTPEGERLSSLLLSFAGTLERHGHDATQLERALDRRGVVISPSLRGELVSRLSACETSLAKLNKQLSRLQPDVALDLDWDYLERQRDVMVAYNQLLSYFEELLGFEEMDTQEALLDGSDGQRVIDKVEAASLRVFSASNDLLPGSTSKETEALQTAAAASGSSSSPPPPELDGDEPPPSYETVISSVNRSSSNTSLQPTKSSGSTPTTPTPPAASPSSSSNPLDFTSGIKHGFRAFTNRLGFFKPDPLASALCEASRLGNVQQIAGLLQQGANVDGRNEDGRAPLICAVLEDHFDAARMLISAGADIHSVSGGGNGSQKWPPLFIAAHAGSLDVAGLLLEKGASPIQTSVSGHSYFYDLVSTIAGKKDKDKDVEEDLDKKSPSGKRPSSGIDGIRYLLERGANPSAQSVSGRRVIVSAARKGRVDIMRLLLDFGADPRTSDYTGNSLISIALDQPNGIDMVELLIRRGGNPNSTSNSGDPVLSGAVSRRNVPIARLLLAAGARASGSDYSGQPVILNAVKDTKLPDEDKTELVRLLLEHGASARARDQTWDGPVLHHAVEKANAEVVSLLVQHGADAAAPRKGEPLLFFAMQSDKPGMAEALLVNGASPNVTESKHGHSALMTVLLKDDMDMVRLLLRHGAEVDEAAREFARALNRPDLLELLRLDQPDTKR